MKTRKELEAQIAELESKLAAAAKPAARKYTRINSVVDAMVETGSQEFKTVLPVAEKLYGKPSESETKWAYRQVRQALTAGLVLPAKPKAAKPPIETPAEPPIETPATGTDN